MKFLKPIMLATIMGQSLIFADTDPTPRVKWMDRMFYTVNRNIKLDAPIWINNESGRNAYGTKYMTSLIKNAHEIAKEYLKYNDYQAYNSFMILALTFPLHEGLYMSYRETFDQIGLCNEEANSGDIMFKETKQDIEEVVRKNFSEIVLDKSKLAQLNALKSIGDDNYEKLKEIVIQDYTRALLDDKKDSIANTDKPSNYRHFVKYLKGGETPFVVECSDVANDNIIRQIIRGGDGSDIGPVQLSLRWHFDEYIAKKKYLSLDESLKYGLNYIHEGFKKLYYDSQDKKNKDYSCIKDGQSINFPKLVRATWAGKYNQGQVTKSCRIEEAADLIELENQISLIQSRLKTAVRQLDIKKLEGKLERATNKLNGLKKHPDYHFHNNLNKVIGFKSKQSIGYIDSISFTPDKKVKAAIDEIISNFNDGKANGTSQTEIKSLLK